MSRHRSGRVMAHVMEYWSHSAFNFNFFQIRGVSGMWSHSVSWDSHKNWARVTQTGSRVTQVRVKTTSQLEHLSVSNFSIHYYFRLRYENQDLKMTPASWDKIQFALPTCYGRETWRATLWHEYYMSYWHVTHVTQEADFWHMTWHLDLIRVTGNEASSFLSRIRVNSPASRKQRKCAKLIISCGVIINGTPATT